MTDKSKMTKPLGDQIIDAVNTFMDDVLATIEKRKSIVIVSPQDRVDEVSKVVAKDCKIAEADGGYPKWLAVLVKGSL